MKFQILQQSEIVVTIKPDDYPESPREWDNLGTMACWHSRYTLGDEQPRMDPDEYLEDLARQVDPDKLDRINDILDRTGYQTPQQYRMEAIKARYIEQTLADNYAILPLYLYDHSGITMNTTGFSCRWDSGQVGIIWASLDRARHEWAGPLPDLDTLRTKTEDCLRAEVETYDMYLTGDVWGYTVERVYYDEDGDEEQRDDLDSCWGFYGRDGCEQEAEGSAKHYRDEQPAQAA